MLAADCTGGRRNRIRETGIREMNIGQRNAGYSEISAAVCRNHLGVEARSQDDDCVRKNFRPRWDFSPTRFSNSLFLQLNRVSARTRPGKGFAGPEVLHPSRILRGYDPLQKLPQITPASSEPALAIGRDRNVSL